MLQATVKNRLFQEIAQVWVAVTFANLLFFLFQIVIGRGLGPEDYSLFASLFAIILVSGALVSGIVVALAKLVASAEASSDGPDPRFIVSSSLLQMALLGAGLLLAFGLASRPIASYLHTSGVSPVMVTGAVVAVSLLMPVALGTLQGRQRFTWLSVMHVVHAGSRLALGVAALVAKLGVTGVLAAAGLSSLIALTVGLAIIKPPFTVALKALPLGTLAKVLFPTTIGSLALSFSTSADVVIVRHFFPASDAGAYAGAVILGRIVLLLPTGVSMVLFPKMAREWALGNSGRVLLYKGLGLTALASGGACLIFVLFPGISVSLILGSEYAGAESLVPIYALSMFFFSLTIVIFYYNLATGRMSYVFLVLLPHFVLEVALIYVLHQSLIQVVLVLLGVNISLAALSQLFTQATANLKPSYLSTGHASPGVGKLGD